MRSPSTLAACTLALVCVCAAGCGDEPRDTDAGTRRDAGPGLGDGGAPADGGGVGVDAGPPDSGPQPCEMPGALEEVACGMCGVASRFCTADGIWEYGPCEGQSGVCVPGTARDMACGSCGTRRELCNAECAWVASGACEGEGGCVPGELVRSPDGCPSGQRDFRCSEFCVLEAISACTSEPCDTPGESEPVACGNCGTRTRFCTSSLEWEYGPCGGEGGCVAGTRRDASCGNCGTREQRCNESCTWVDFGTCEGQGECSPGSSSTTGEGCSDGQTRPLTCDATCTYTSAGACGGGGPGELGDLCTAGSCRSGLVCDFGTGVGICRQPCTETPMCPMGTVCFTSDMTCSDDCSLFFDTGCPEGTKCDLVGSGTLGADPITVCTAIGTFPAGAACTANSQCQHGYVCVTGDDGTGNCTAMCDLFHPCATGTCSGLIGAGYCL